MSPEIKIYLVPAAEKDWLALDGQERESIKAVIRAAMAAGPHKHTGAGMRELSNGFHEIRHGIENRVVFLHEPNAATIYLIGGHDAVSNFVNNRPRKPKKGWEK